MDGVARAGARVLLPSAIGDGAATHDLQPEREESTMTHDAALLAAAIEIHCMLLDTESERPLDAAEQLQMDASEAIIRRLLPRFLEDAR